MLPPFQGATGGEVSASLTAFFYAQKKDGGLAAFAAATAHKKKDGLARICAEIYREI